MESYRIRDKEREVALRYNLATDISLAKSTVGIKNFSLRRGRVRKKGKIGLNHSLMFIHPCPPTVATFFIYSLSTQ